MSNPLQKTLDFLSTSSSPHAVDVLTYGLRVPDEQVRVGSLAALLKRHSTRGNIEIIRNLEHLTPEMRAVLDRQSGVMAQALRQALLHGDVDLRTNALEMVRWFEDYVQLPALLNLLEEQDNPLHDDVTRVIRELVNHLYEHLHFGKEPGPDAGEGLMPAPTFLRDATKIRHQSVASLESSCHRYEAHRSVDVVEGLLILGGADHFLVKKVLHDASEDCREALRQVLVTSTHPGVMSLVVDSLALNYPAALALEAFGERTDPEFISFLLRTWPRKLTPFQQKNFKEVKRIAWLAPEHLQLELVPPALQKTLIAFLLSIGVPEDQRLTILEWMVMHGTPEGRLAATDVLVDLEDNKVKEVIVESLDSDEADIQAWATSQLRVRDVPHAFELLVKRLDSPMPEVREAARAELGDFDVHRVLEMYDHLEPRLCLAVGKLIQKIDPQAVEKLQQEMSVAIRRRRIRAARAALAMGLQQQVLIALLTMAQDSDTLVRRTALEVLGSIPTRQVASVLNEHLNDSSPRVREAAARSLQQVHAGMQAAAATHVVQ